MRVLDRGTIYDNPEGHPARRNVCFPNLELLSDGRLIVNCRVGSGKQTPDGDLLFFESADEGRTWRRMGVKFDWMLRGVPGWPCVGYLSEVEPGRLLMTVLWVDASRGDVPFFNPDTEGLLPVKMLLTESADGGRSWSAFWEVDTSPFIQATPTGPIMRLADGTLLQYFEVNKQYEDTSPWFQKAGVVFSYDGGRTWRDAQVVAHDPTRRVFYWDQRETLLPDGRILAIFWTYDNENGKDIDLHYAISQDGGRTWPKPAPTGIVGEPTVPVALGGERVLLLSVHRWDPPCLRAILSEDGGRTWDDQNALVFYEKPMTDVPHSDTTAEYLQDQELWSFGLCTGRALPGGDVLVVYYAGDSEQTGMHWVRVEM
jgi:hypothetical protein